MSKATELVEALRQAGKKAMGMSDKTYYHASKQDIDEFIPGYQDGLTFLTPDAKFANRWLGSGKYQERLGGKADEIYEKEYANLRDNLDKERFSEEGAYFETQMKKKRQLQEDRQYADNAIYPLNTNVKNTFDPENYEHLTLLEDYVTKANKEMAEIMGGTPKEQWPVDLSIKDFESGHYGEYEEKEVVDFLRTRGFDSMRLKESISEGADSPYTTLAVFDPANIRSVNAKFDPKNAKSRNILAGVGGASLLGAAVNPQTIQAQEPQTLTDTTSDFLADALRAIGMNPHRAADNAEILTTIAGFNPTMGAIQLGSDVGHYARKAKDYLSNNFIGENPLFADE